MKVTKIRAGLYGVNFPSGKTYLVENVQSPVEWGSEWLWYVTESTGTEVFDPFHTKRSALETLSNNN